MQKFRSKPVVVEAQQWHAGAKIDGAEPEKLEVRYSIDRRLYYISGGPNMPRCWLTTDITSGPVPEEQKKVDVFAGQPVEFKHKDGRVWHRLMYPFSYWKVTSGDAVPADPVSDLVLDFAAFHEWKSLEPGFTFVMTPEGRRYVSPGEWLIKLPGGRFRVMTPTEFKRAYEPAE